MSVSSRICLFHCAFISLKNSVKFLWPTKLLCLSGCKNLKRKKKKPERETRKTLNDFSSRPHVCDNERFLLYASICSGRSAVIWATNCSNLLGARACETTTSRTQRFKAPWTMCRVLAKEGAEPPSPTDCRRLLFLSSLVPACCRTSGKALPPGQRSCKPWCSPPFCWRSKGALGGLAGGGVSWDVRLKQLAGPVWLFLALKYATCLFHSLACNSRCFRIINSIEKGL